eukprot:Transcript_27631.p1 GENE.Transcript_27631~~Transcript_27631.p1  ORF type:complete len:246 (+),score=34.65 Transcript_27631:87-824(+)
MSLTSDRGQLYTWGLGDYGKLGHGDTTPQLLPRHLEFFRAVRIVWASGGAFHSAAVEEMGQVYTWGGGMYGKLGQRDTMNSLTPRPVKDVNAGAHFGQVECGPFHTVAVTKLGDVYTWGFGGNGRLGLAEQGQLNTEQRLTPELVRTLQGAAMRFRLNSTARGIRTSMSLSWPSLPKAPEPHEKTWPAVVATRVCAEPQATEATLSPDALREDTTSGVCRSWGGPRSSSDLPFCMSFFVSLSTPS